ncbi:protein FREE1-like [Aristolochia californica]|uniref:protein FREE1-like n=1 Tax=Aristolochia californica TaxID=171875 RepID=UPI0035D6998D
MQSGSGDYAASYYHQPPPYVPPSHQNLNPNLNDLLTGFPPTPNPPTFASAPPFSPYNPQPDMSSYSTNYPPFSQHPDPAPTAPSFSQQTPPSFSLFNYQPPASEPPAQTYPPPATVPYYSYEHHPPAGNYGSTPLAQVTNPTPGPGFYPNSYPHLAPPVPPVYDNPYESSGFDQSGVYRAETSGYGQGQYGRTSSNYDRSDALEDGVYAYDGGRGEPYGARGTGGPRSSSVAFDDYGRSLTSHSSPKESTGSGKIVRAVPKTDPQQDVRNGVQKFRVKLLVESGGQSTMDILCQIGLDGIRMLDPNSNRTLRIYPLETVTRWEVNDPSIYTFWAKTSVDIEPRRIRLQSNSYTTSTLLDTITAATVQLKEMGGKDSFRNKGSSDGGRLPDPPGEKRKGFTDWMNLIKPGIEEKDHWVPDEVVTKCTGCGTDFGAFVRKHHCRNCGDIFCDKCTHGRIALTADLNAQPVRVCDRCLAEVSQRLSNAKEAASRPSVLTSHEDLAKKLQEEMERNRKASSASKSSDGSGKRMREVACPTCTVHLQVQVPASGSETIECGVCQHPFLVSAH